MENPQAGQQELYRILTEKSFAGIYVVQDGVFRYLNKNAASYAGYTPDELVGRPPVNIVHPEDRDNARENARAMLLGEKTSPSEFRVVTKDGHIRWIIETITSITWEGKPAILGNSMDVTERRRAEETTRESQRRLSDIINFLPDATFAIDLEGRVIAWNIIMEQITGIKREDILGKGDYEYSLPFYGVRRPMLIDLAIKPDADIEKKYSFVSRDKDSVIAESVSRHLIPVQDVFLWIKASPICDASGNIVGAIETIRDITQRKKAEDNLRQSEERYRTIIENIGDGYYEVDLKGNITFLNDAALRIIGIPRSEVQGANFKTFATGEDAAMIYGAFHQVYLTGAPFRGVSWRAVRPDGKDQHLEVSVSLIRDTAARPIGFRGIMHDITERRKSEESIQYMAYHDPLTGLPNRLLFYDRFSQILAHARRNQEQFAVVMLDLDKFKDVNDRLGHDAGDQLLRGVAERLSSQMRDGDTVARFGGDEFLLLLPGIKQIEDLAPLGQKVLQAFQQPFAVSGQELSIRSSIGIAVFPDDGSDRDILVQKADFAMYRAKSAGGNRWTR